MLDNLDQALELIHWPLALRVLSLIGHGDNALRALPNSTDAAALSRALQFLESGGVITTANVRRGGNLTPAGRCFLEDLGMI
jgi:hypothetical protein